MICPKCGSSNIEMRVEVTISAPATMEMDITKSNIRKKEVELISANWNKARFICRNSPCIWKLDESKVMFYGVKNPIDNKEGL